MKIYIFVPTREHTLYIKAHLYAVLCTMYFLYSAYVYVYRMRLFTSSTQRHISMYVTICDSWLSTCYIVLP